MWEWLFQPIDAERAHLVGFAVSWHGRAMVLAWAVLAPLAIIITRYFKVLPGQDWPRELDSQFWWRVHWMGQAAVLLLTVFGVGLILSAAGALGVHGVIGYLVLAFVFAQVALGLLRGTKGGPTARDAGGDMRGDHYDMSRWRLFFEAAHKSLGYLTLILALVATGLGLWAANAPHWMWLALSLWLIGLGAATLHFQAQGRAIDTYQAIWGPSLEHPGNRKTAQGWGMRRIEGEEAADVRGD